MGRSMFKVGVVPKTSMMDKMSIDEMLVKDPNIVHYTQVTDMEFHDWTHFCMDLSGSPSDVVLVFLHELTAPESSVVMLSDVVLEATACPSKFVSNRMAFSKYSIQY